MAEPDVAAPAADGEVAWKTDTRDRQFVAARGRSGVVYRQGEESIEEAYARDAKGPPDKRPKKAKAQPRKPPAPTTIDLKELEFALAEGLKAPAIMAAMAGDQWGAQHFEAQAPIVARNLVMCAQHNPWLHQKLVAAVTGEGLLMNVMVFASLGAALFSYVVPPIIYYLNPPFVPEAGAEMLREKYRIPAPSLEDPFAAPAAPEFPQAA